MPKKQGYDDRLDESMGGRSGRKSQSEKDRRDESEGMEKSMGRRKFAAVGTMDKGRRKMSIYVRWNILRMFQMAYIVYVSNFC